MYRKFILPLLLAVLSVVTPSAASAQQLSFEFCSALGTMGGAMMQDRQNNLPISTPRTVILQWHFDGVHDKQMTELLLTVLNEAYSFPVQATVAQKNTIVREFSAYVTESCLSA